MTDQLRHPDYDIGEGMNLVWNIDPGEMAYPKLLFDYEGKKTKPSVITVGDSYYWGFFGAGLHSRLFEMGGFWYYFQQYYKRNNTHGWIKDLDVKKEIEQQDFIILLSTEATLRKFAFGFIEKVHELFFDDLKKMNDEDLKLIIKIIKKDTVWMKTIEQKALERNIPLDSMILNDAKWYYKNKYRKAI